MRHTSCHAPYGIRREHAIRPTQSTGVAAPQAFPALREYMIRTRPVAGSPQPKYISVPSSVIDTSAAMLQPGIVTTSGVPEQVAPFETQCMMPAGPFQ